MKNEYKFAGIILIIMLISLSSCPGLFKDTEYCIIDNKSDYTIDVFVDGELKNTVTPGTTYQFGLYTEQVYSILCTSGDIQWGPKTITLEKGHPYTWAINNPEPLPQADITINNNSSWIVNIYIAGSLEGTINAGFSNTYAKEIGNYNLVATPQGTNGSWQQNINLAEEGYIWDIESDIELYPSENCRVWNFENNFADHLGVADWDEKHETIFSTSLNKFGNYSLFTNDNSSGWLTKENYWIVGNSISFGAWINIAMINSNTLLFLSVEYWDDVTLKNNSISIQIFKDKVHFTIGMNPYSATYIEDFSVNLIDNNWHYLSVSYDSINNILYGTVDNNIITINNPPGSWSTGVGAFFINVKNLVSLNVVSYIDEAIIIPDQFIDPQTFVDHFNHDVPWGAEYIP